MNEKSEICQIQNFVESKVNQYFGKSVEELKRKFQPKNNKAKFAVLTRKMMKVTTNLNEFEGIHSSVLIKSVRITGNEMPAESMSFNRLNFKDWCDNDNWHNTQTYKFFKNNYLALFVYQQYPSGQRVADKDIIFKNVKVIKIPDYDLEHGFEEVWADTRQKILGNKLIITVKMQKNGRTVRKNNLPAMSFNGVAHLRPGGKDGNDMETLPNGQHIAQQRFWLNKQYIQKLLEEQ